MLPRPSARRPAASGLPAALTLAAAVLLAVSGACTRGTRLGHIPRVEAAPPAAPFADDLGVRRHERAGGLVVEVLREGQGPVLRSGSRARVHLSARLAGERQPFATTRKEGVPMRVHLDRTPLIPGLRRGLQGLSAGAVARLYVPAALAWGQQEDGPVPPGSDVIFDLEVVSVD